ncbi:hypothetical protein GCM10017083_05530 [Thalassobaculum fulvum]|uniref:DUF2125 domain-containing protein n=1 Tax=Thalassobaculum fulvum TaxID=1633335 RepID=A0A918XP61_9PROT|nr:DUF2125 domain-containing protein [Thalassobaculum fulvum]GHD41290.1 hypothetical protein GCM10017083_05530 [Thalassobaculum fulvum]
MSPPDTTRPAGFQDRRHLRRRRLVVAGAGLAALLAAGWTIAWQLVALRVEAAVTGWIDQRRALGDRIEHGPPALGGFPFTVDVTMRQVHWTREDGPTLLAAAAPELVASTPVWDPFRVAVRPVGGGRASAAGSWGSVTADADEALAVVTLGRRAPDRVDVTLRNIELTGPGGVVWAHVAAFDAVVDPTPEAESGAIAAVPATLDVSGTATGIRPAGAEALPFEGPAAVSWRAALRGDVDPAAGLPGLAMWRDAGGVIDVQYLSVSWPPIDLVGDGTVALDAAMRPEGAGVAEVQGIGEALDRLVAKGRMKPADAALLKLAAIAAGEPAADGRGQRVKAPVTVQDGTVRVGRIPVAKVRSIAE